MNEKSHLTEKKCLPCSGNLEPLPHDRVGEYLKKVPAWELSASHGTGHSPSPLKIVRTWKFQDFKEALAFVNRVGELAEQEGHHPDIAIHWNRVTLELWTHVAKGLTENDFILASKINGLENACPPS